VRPSADELLNAIAEQLGTQVLPAVQDKWAASTVRSAMQLLRHLALRVAQEPRLLAVEAQDLGNVLTQAAEHLQHASQTALHATVQAALALPVPAGHDIEAQTARDEAWLGVVEQLIAARDALCATTGSSVMHDALVAYLERRLLRERDLIAPFINSPPI
jgi:hypothetical protein